MRSREDVNAYQRARYARLKAEGRARRDRTDYHREYKRRRRAAIKAARETAND